MQVVFVGIGIAYCPCWCLGFKEVLRMLRKVLTEAVLGLVWGCLGAVLGPSWAAWGSSNPFGSRLGTVLARLGAGLGLSSAVLKTFSSCFKQAWDCFVPS